MAHLQMSGVALIAGAGSGIGKETAFTFAERGAAVVVFADINEPAAAAAAERSKAFSSHPNYRAEVKLLNAADRASFQRVVNETVEDFGRIDYFVNSAGVSASSDKLLGEADLVEFQNALNINCLGMLHGVATVSTAMLKQSESFMNGRSGMVPVPLHIQYTTSKFASRGVTLTAVFQARELGGEGVRVNAVCPSWADTPLMERNIARQPYIPELVKTRVPLGRMAHVEEIAGAIHFLCSPDASYINGEEMVIDAGLTLSPV